MDKNKNQGTSDMPSPKIIDYNVKYKLTPLFLSDLKIVLKDLAYVEVCKFFNYIERHNGIFPSAILDEFIGMLEKLPYSTIYPLMHALHHKDNFDKYFQKLS